MAAHPVVGDAGVETGIDTQHPDRQAHAAGVRELVIEHGIELPPNIRARRVADEHAVINRPRFLATPPGHYFNFNAVSLDVRTGGEEQASGRDGADRVILAPIV